MSAEIREDAAPERSPDYVAIVKDDGSAVIHRPMCAHAQRASSPVHWAVADDRDGDRPCTRCLPEGIEAAEAKRLLEPWAQRHEALVVALDEFCRSASDAELAALAKAAEFPSQTNCGWGTYQVAPLVRGAVRLAQHERRSSPEQPPSDSDA